jgi:hypothetical protein
MSCSAPRPLSTVAVAPPRMITGDCASWAFFTAVIVLVRPGPAVTAATPGTPVSRATASAANTALTSWRTSITRMSRRLAPTRIGEMCPPHSVNRNRTPLLAQHLSDQRAAVHRGLPLGCSIQHVPFEHEARELAGHHRLVAAEHLDRDAALATGLGD